jgi:hypothetical protein
MNPTHPIRMHHPTLVYAPDIASTHFGTPLETNISIAPGAPVGYLYPNSPANQ